MNTIYNPQEGDLVVHTYKGEDEYCLMHKRGGESVFRALAKGLLRSGSPAHVSILKWARLGGRFVFELASSTPPNHRLPPSEIIRLTHTVGGFAGARIKKRTPFPSEFVAGVWGSATEEEITGLIRDYAKSRYDLSHYDKIDVLDPRLDILMARLLSTPLGQPVPTNDL